MKQFTWSTNRQVYQLDSRTLFWACGGVTMSMTLYDDIECGTPSGSALSLPGASCTGHLITDCESHLVQVFSITRPKQVFSP